MKKIILMFLAVISMSTFAITAQEAIATKNFYIINNYCKSNNIINMCHFLCRSNNVNFATYNEINNSYTNSVGICFFKKNAIYFYTIDEANSLKYIYDDQSSDYFKMIINNINSESFKKLYSNKENLNHKLCMYLYNLFIQYIEKCSNNDNVVSSAIKLDSMTGLTECKDIVSKRENLSIKNKFNLAIAYNDVDKIIDASSNFNFGEITSDQVSNIIKPLNSVANEYRKAEILTILKNINSACTINLYDDQKTWEPLLSKIRAMISVRQ